MAVGDLAFYYTLYLWLKQAAVRLDMVKPSITQAEIVHLITHCTEEAGKVTHMAAC